MTDTSEDTEEPPRRIRKTYNHSRMVRTNSLLLAFACLFITFFLTQREAGAYTIEQRDEQVTGQFLITPVKAEIDLFPGQSVTREVMVANHTGKQITLDFSLEDFAGSPDPSESHVFLGDEDSPWSARAWLDPEMDSIVLDQGEMVTFDVKISAPSDAAPGGHYAALFASSQEVAETGEGNVRLTSRVGTLFLIKMAGEIESMGTLNEPEVPSITNFGPINIGLVFNNLGNVHETPSGRVEITNIFGQTVADIPVDEWVVLPESSRRIEVEWGNKWHLGPYNVNAEIVYGEEGNLISATSTIWFFPWPVILAVIIGVLFILLMVFLIVKKRRTSRGEAAESMGMPEPPVPPVEPETELETAKEAVPAEEAVIATAAPGKTMLLNELLPSIGDNRMVDISDEETRQLIKTLINNEIDLARSYMMEGKNKEARRELMEARTAALKMELLSEVAVIDDFLLYL